MTAGDPAMLLEGVYVANVTPFRDDARYSIDVDAYLAHVRWLAGQGVTGVIPFGTNGEGPSVSASEKRTVLRALLADPGGLYVVPTVAEGNLPDTLDLLAELEDLPVRAVMVLPPYFFKPVSAEGLRPFYERVLAATRHPVVVYHVPKYAVPVPADLVTSLPVWGVKDSGGEAGYAATVSAAGKGVLVGTEDDLPARLPTAQGAISALANIVPEQVVALYGHVRGGRSAEAAALSAHLQRVRAMTKEHAAPGVLKRVAQRRHGHPMGTVRPPLVPVPDSFDAAAATERAVAVPVG
ncbi:dihydrodipicolinate synthase family protein [Geodermatophilus sabuli]|uniref:4-hydroxy-tetrahydrodipicolinate synthase n=1 Tax=Geodermatophilus sabuli TaxID=1564158 RepID=A0A285EHV1_9ACTN|nr:dihydrodipicolinate synthase family protein [Geodermatophilus sabuli]MBB3083942.1 4-hydroxy-tetrahydrodipicolinate synthase [Geodermatophilus sabuli]SNX98590.1 4-hydroxy-tetrahydrodipicolinate synthase [Geodermatophilus sabuli]